MSCPDQFPGACYGPDLHYTLFPAHLSHIQLHSLNMMSSPPPVGQGWHLPLEVVQPRSGGCESLQSTVVCDHPMVHMCKKKAIVKFSISITQQSTHPQHVG